MPTSPDAGGCSWCCRGLPAIEEPSKRLGEMGETVWYHFSNEYTFMFYFWTVQWYVGLYRMAAVSNVDNEVSEASGYSHNSGERH